jgi:hypothetical protein
VKLYLHSPNTSSWRGACLSTGTLTILSSRLRPCPSSGLSLSRFTTNIFYEFVKVTVLLRCFKNLLPRNFPADGLEVCFLYVLARRKHRLFIHCLSGEVRHTTARWYRPSDQCGYHCSPLTRLTCAVCFQVICSFIKSSSYACLFLCSRRCPLSRGVRTRFGTGPREKILDLARCDFCYGRQILCLDWNNPDTTPMYLWGPPSLLSNGYQGLSPRA